MFAIQAFVLIKILLLIFVGVAIFLLSKKAKPVYFLWLVGAASALAYYFLVRQQPLLLWGLQGDELTIAAMYSALAHVGLWSDFAYHILPPFYPPAWFWFLALPGRIFNWNGIQMAKSGAFSFLLFFPVLMHYLSDFLWRKEDRDTHQVGSLTLFLSPLIMFVVLDKDLLIGKPYEILAGAITIIWVIAVYVAVLKNKWSWRQMTFFGVIAGLIFMTYYLWLVFAAIVFALLGLEIEKGGESRFYGRLLTIVPVALVTSLPFLWPLILSYARNGTENWQTAFFTPDGLNLWLPMFSDFSLKSLVLLGGLFVLVFYRQNKFVKPLLYFFLAAFVWWLMGLVTLFFGAPFQEFRGFYVLAPLALAVAAAFGIERLWLRYEIGKKENWRLALGVLGILFFAAQSVFGFFIDDYRMRNEKMPPPKISVEMKSLIDFVRNDANSANKLTLHTVPLVLAFEPMNSLVYFNQHNSHPAAHFSERFYYVKRLAAAPNAVELQKLIKNCPFGQLKRFIFFSDKDYYYLYFHLDKFGAGIRVEEIKFPKKNFSEKYFQTVFVQGGYVVLEVK